MQRRSNTRYGTVEAVLLPALKGRASAPWRER